MVVPLDGAFRVKDMAPSIQAVKKAAAASNGDVGVGLVSMMGFEHTRNELSVSPASLLTGAHTYHVTRYLDRCTELNRPSLCYVAQAT